MLAAKTAKLERDLAMEIVDQELAPASPKAREHIASAFRALVEAGKDPADALKQVAADEPYLFKAKTAPQPQNQQQPPKQSPKTEPRQAGPTQQVRQAPPPTAEKQPGDAQTFEELSELVKKKHGIRLVR